jgi:hypothetical protein
LRGSARDKGKEEGTDDGDIESFLRCFGDLDDLELASILLSTVFRDEDGLGHIWDGSCLIIRPTKSRRCEKETRHSVRSAAVLSCSRQEQREKE